MDIDIKPGEIKVGKFIGEGGFGQVFEATQRPLNVSLAIKMLRPSAFNNYDVALERFFQEAEILMTLRHPNIIAVYGFGEHEGSPYILMERFKGFDLQRAYTKIGPADLTKVLPFILRASDAFHHAHSHPVNPVVHRDVKPSNLMSLSGDARVLDFGIAKILDPDRRDLTIDGQTLTGGAFSDPHLVENPRLNDPKSDVYSLGACWYYTLTGLSPGGSNVTEQLKGVKGMTPEYESVVVKCLSAFPSRYHNMLELKNDVVSLMEEGTPDARLDDLLDEDSMLLLGTIFGKYEPEKKPQSYWELQRDLSSQLNEFKFSISLSKLRERAFISNEELHDNNGNIYSDGVTVTDSGTAWIRNHSQTIGTLLNRIVAPSHANNTQDFSDDIPF